MNPENYCAKFLLWFTLGVGILPLLGAVSAPAATSVEIQEWLQAHNTHRVFHGVPAVTWSDTVAASAQAYADTCPTSHSGSGYGENLAWATNNLGATAVVDMWYDEEPLYDYNNPGFSSDTGHFTQVVWKNTTEIGCGFATGCSGWPNVWVCQYNPPGNYLNQFAENVFPPGTDNGDDSEDNDSGSPPSAGTGSQVPTLSLLLLQN